MVLEPVAARGFYTLRQIKGYTVVGGGLRMELKIGERVRIFLDTLLRDCEKDDSVAGSIPFVP